MTGNIPGGTACVTHVLQGPVFWLQAVMPGLQDKTARRRGANAPEQQPPLGQPTPEGRQ
jgi:hypothetical protein